MTTATKARTVSASATLIALKGKGKALREGAFMRIAPLSFVENASRAETIANLRVALGDKPSEAETACAKSEWVIGRIACRMPAGEFPKAGMDSADKLEFARTIVCDYVPFTNAAKPRPLAAGKTGRRSDGQQRAFQAATEAWSQIVAELGLGSAQTPAERAKAKEAKRTRGASVNKTNETAPTPPMHAALVKPVPAATADDFVASLGHLLTSLSGYINKTAKIRPAEFSEVAATVVRLKTQYNTAMNAYGERKAKLDAERAAKESDKA